MKTLSKPVNFALVYGKLIKMQGYFPQITSKRYLCNAKTVYNR